jgi:nucleoside-diphosphate-sugar epimerase
VTQQTVVVFGGSGFIGSHLLERLAADPDVNPVSVDIAAPKWTTPGVTYLTADVRERIDLPDVARPTRIVNLAAIHRTPGHPEHEYYETNVRGALSICDFARAHDVRQITFTSSISVYGPCEEPTDERSPLRPTSSYGRSKLIAEEVHRRWLAEDPQGRRLVVVRPAVVFGYGEGGNFERLRKALHARRFVYPGRTDTVKACIYVEELLDAIDWAVDRGESVTFNGAYPARTTIEEICRAFETVDGAPPPRGKVPLAAVLGAARVLQVADRLGAPNAIHPDRVRKLVESTNIVPTTLQELGYPWKTDLESALRSWFEDERRRGTRS